MLLVAALAIAVTHSPPAAQQGLRDVLPFKDRHVGVSPREEATRHPRSERDQAIVDGWPFYRTDRGQEAFNEAMATLKATDGPAPAAETFKGCLRLECQVALPSIGRNGWAQPGRIWVSPSEYVLIVKSSRNGDGSSYRRRSARGLQYFVFHEFHNSSRNTDVYDTISSHSGRVFVPFYMSKQATDAKGRRFVIVVQVAPYDVVSIHATNLGSAGPGIEVAKNASDELEPLQGLAGIIVASMVKALAPRLEVTNHRGEEGREMLEAYEQRLARLGGRVGASRLTLPFVAALPERVAAASGRLADVLWKGGPMPSAPVADGRIVPPKPQRVWPITR